MIPRWLKSFWEKCDRFDVMIEFNDTLLEIPRCGDKWLMREFLRCWFSANDLMWHNIVLIHMQVLFLSDILSASGKILDGKYLVQRKTDKKWLKLNVLKEQPPNKDYTLCEATILQVLPAGGVLDRLGNLTQVGHKIWNWHQNEDNSSLMHYI